MISRPTRTRLLRPTVDERIELRKKRFERNEKKKWVLIDGIKKPKGDKEGTLVAWKKEEFFSNII